MNLELDNDQVALRDTVRRFLTTKASVATHVRPMLDDPAGTTAEVHRGLAGLGAIGLLIPEESGGAGMTMTEAGIVAEELGAALHPGPWFSCAVTAPRLLTHANLAGSTAPLLAAIADGSVTVTVGPLAGPRPNAAEHDDVSTLRGRMTAIPDVAAADTLLVVADTPDGPAIFATPTAAEGIVVVPEPTIDRTRKLFEVTLHDVSAQRLGPVSPGAIQATVDDTLIAYAADALGAATAVMTEAIEYAKTRSQFGAPIGSFQAVQHLCVDMYETVELARSGVIHALWAADTGDPAERHLAAVRAKAFAAQLATVGDAAIQVFGGIGYTWEHNAHLYLKRLLSWSAFLGGADGYLEEIGAHLATLVTGGAGGR